ncbi:MAG: hypothetical protein DHS20C01_37420 [marine bacterium B5-7]|nr:MAG: hypothetical protein DHS20C01_37420 [marine bacterium B5-7]
MQIQIYTIPILGGEELNDELNRFLRSKNVLQVESQLVSCGQNAFWCFCIKYIEEKSMERGKKRVDYREVLDDDSFRRFSRMREIRKRLAQAEAIPAYAVFTDEELAEMAKLEDLTLAAMKKVKGIGQKKVEKYGGYFIPGSSQNEKS